jgi:hypothetical protein
MIEVAIDHRKDISNVDGFHAATLFSKCRRSSLFVEKYDDRSVGMFDVNVGRFVFITSKNSDSDVADAENRRRGRTIAKRLGYCQAMLMTAIAYQDSTPAERRRLAGDSQAEGLA